MGKVVLKLSDPVAITNGDVVFEGVLMSKLLTAVGATGTTLSVFALNDDRAYMPVRDKGPLFVVYPHDSDPALKHQVYDSRSGWQVARMVVK